MNQRILSLFLIVTLSASGCSSFASGPTLTIDNECRNGGTVHHLGVEWLVTEPLPQAWKDEETISGTIEQQDNDNAVFLAEGHRVMLSKSSTLECLPWDAPVEIDEGPDPDNP